MPSVRRPRPPARGTLPPSTAPAATPSFSSRDNQARHNPRSVWTPLSSAERSGPPVASVARERRKRLAPPPSRQMPRQKESSTTAFCFSNRTAKSPTTFALTNLLGAFQIGTEQAQESVKDVS